MALFNRKKGDASTPEPEEGKATAESGAFDFDAISRDLDAQNGASSFDSLLASPATNAPGPRPTDSFDFPETDPLGLGVPPADTSSTIGVGGRMPATPTPEAVINAPLVSPGTGVVPLETAPVVVSPPTANKKKTLPLVPLLGALGLLAVAGGGAMFLLNSSSEAPDAETTPLPIRVRPAPPMPERAPDAPVTPDRGLRSASPGIAPPSLPAAPIARARPQGASGIPMGGRPVDVSKLPSATAGLDPQVASQLKQLWRVGAAAKKRGDFVGARTAWQEALRVRPGHPGFQESIDKLPR